MKPVQALLAHWRQLAPRERRALGGMALLLAVIGIWLLLWLPGQQRLVQARRDYQEQLALAQLTARVQPRQATTAAAPLPSHLHDTALAAGLAVTRFDVDTQALHLSVTGSPGTLLDWLQRMERQGTLVESLVLEVSGEGLQLSVESGLESSPGAR